ncbi:MAG: hypothetical protein HY718_10320 [Planctomycetes bacterium]|nr:hypothetical protein [Planctomycetota bacterium]
MFARQAILWSGLAFLSAGPRSDAVQILALERWGEYQPVGTLVQYDTQAPASGQVVGQTGLAVVGAMDFFNGRLWAASAAGGRLRFWQINPQTAQATLISAAGSHTEAFVFGGSFDPQGRFWVTDLGLDTLACYDPWTGQRISSAPIQSNLVIPGLAFLGSTLYALGIVTPVGSGPSSVGTLNPSTGEFTPLAANSGVGGSNGFDYDPTSGKLFATYPSGSPSASSGLRSIDPTTGLSTSLGRLTPIGTYDAIAVVPEPAGMFLLGFGVLLWPRRRSGSAR